MTLGQAHQSLQDAHTFDAALLEHRLGPARRLNTDAPHLCHQPGAAAFNAADHALTVGLAGLAYQHLGGHLGLVFGSDLAPALAPGELAPVTGTGSAEIASYASVRLLATTVKTGTYCRYTPDPRLPVNWEL